MLPAENHKEDKSAKNIEVRLMTTPRKILAIHFRAKRNFVQRVSGLLPESQSLNLSVKSGPESGLDCLAYAMFAGGGQHYGGEQGHRNSASIPSVKSKKEKIGGYMSQTLHGGQ